MFNSGKVIIFDRLHATIFALLMHNRPEHFGPNIKVTRTRNIAFNVAKKCLDKEEMRYDEVDTVEEAIKSAAEMIRKYQID